MCSVSVPWNAFGHRKDFCTSAWRIREGLTGEVTLDLGLHNGWNFDGEGQRA